MLFIIKYKIYKVFWRGEKFLLKVWEDYNPPYGTYEL